VKEFLQLPNDRKPMQAPSTNKTAAMTERTIVRHKKVASMGSTFTQFKTTSSSIRQITSPRQPENHITPFLPSPYDLEEWANPPNSKRGAAATFLTPRARLPSQPAEGVEDQPLIPAETAQNPQFIKELYGRFSKVIEDRGDGAAVPAFEEFKEQYYKLLSNHQGCGENCLHLRRFYLRLGYNSKYVFKPLLGLKNAEFSHLPRMKVTKVVK
jgi:hypothetical protein